jgi:xylulokinase
MTAPPLLAGVDAGTTRIRALLFEPDGTIAAEGSMATPTVHTRPDWAHHEAEALWRATADALRQATARIDDPRRISGLAVASVGEAAVPLDAKGEPSYHAIAWFDRRAVDEFAWLERTIGAEKLFALTGLNAKPIHGLNKLLWLKANEPEAYRRTKSWLNIADYLAWRLTGVAATDYSIASRTLALDIRTLEWAGDLLAEVGVPLSLFQPLRPSGARLGPVTKEAARQTGLPESCIVGVGGHDHILGALAAGAWREGVVVNSLGTAEALLVALDRPIDGVELGRRGYSEGAIVVDRPRYYAVGGLITSGAAIDWFRRLLGSEISDADLISEGEAVPPGSLGVCFLPHLRMASPPRPDAAARGAFIGLGTEAGRGVLYRAVLEGTAYDARAILEGLLEFPGMPAVRSLRAIGGSTRNRLLMAIKAAVYDREIIVAEMPETVSLAAAILGGLAAGVYPDLARALAGIARPERVVKPDPGLAALYDRRFREVYCPACEGLDPLHQAVAEIDRADR